jgi:hypothetical protein
MFIAEKPASHGYDVEKGRRASITSFVMRGYSSQRNNQNEDISVDEYFSFSLLSFLISVSSFSSADSNALNTNRSLTQSKEDTSSDEKYSSMFLLSSDKLCRNKFTRFLSNLQRSVSSNISTLLSFSDSGSPQC